MVSNYSLADVTIGETPHKQGNIPPSSQPQEGKIISSLLCSGVGHSEQDPHVLSVPQD